MLTRRWILLTVNLSCLAIAHALFLHLTEASPSVQPFLLVVFGIASLGVTIIWPRRVTLRCLLLANSVFYLLWSAGIVGATRVAAALLSGHPTLFYGTSGVQFWQWNGSAHAFFAIAFLPAIALILLLYALLRHHPTPQR